MKHTLKYLLINWLIIFASIFLSLRFNFLYPLTFFIIANRQFANFLVGHDAVHGAISKNAFFNNFIGRYLCLHPVFVSFEAYKVNHFAHHEFLGTEIDPDKGLYNFYPISFKKYFSSTLVHFISLKMLWDFISYFTSFRSILKNKKWGKLLEGDTLQYLGFHLLIFSLVNYYQLWGAYLFLWLLPMLLLIPYYHFVNALQHGGIFKMDFPDNSRNIDRPQLLMEVLLPCHTNYHGLHHQYPQVPFHALPRLYKVKRLEGESYNTCLNRLFQRVP